MALFAGSSYDVITKFLPDAVDKYFAAESKTVILENGSKWIDVNFNEAGYVKIASFLLDGLSDYYKTQVEPRPASPAGYAAYAGNLGSGERDGFDIGGTDVSWEIFKLQWCRGRQFRIDHIADEESGKVITGGLIEEFHRLHVIPEVDACRFSVIADAASATMGNLVTETISSSSGDQYINPSNILGKFFKMRKWLVENGVPLEELVWFVSPDVYEVLVNSTDLTKFITQEDYRSEKGLTIQVMKFNDVPVIEVPSSRFFTNVLTTRNGYQAQSSSRPINYMMCSKKAVVPVRKIEHSKIYGEELTGLAGYYGTMMNYLLYHGVVIPRNKMIGTYVSIGSSSPLGSKANVLLVNLVAGDTSGATKFKAFYTQPSALRGTVVYAGGTGAGSATNPFTVGSAVTGIDESNGPVSIKVGADFSEAVLSAAFFALVDYRGICVATTSSAITLPKKA